MPSPATPSMKCQHCTQKATLACAGCIAAPDTRADVVKTTWYCGMSCQKADWNNHKGTCKASQARNFLFRAGEIAHHTFYVYREKVFDEFVLSVERNKDHIKTKDDQADKQALLSCWACADALAYMHGLVKSLLRGTCKEISDVTILTKNHRRSFIKVGIPAPYDNDSTKYGHKVIQVTLKDSEKYVLEIAGAQYGQFAPVIPLDLYVASHAKDMVRQLEIGSTRERITSPTYCNGSTDMQLKKTFNKFLSETMDAKIEEWQRSNMTLPAMLKLPGQAHLEKRSVFLAYLNGELGKAKLCIQGKLSGRARGPITGALLDQWLRIDTCRRE